MRGWHISECQSCGSAFSEVAPSAEEISEIYEDLYKKHGLFEQHRQEVSRFQCDMAKKRPVKVGWEQKRFFKRCPPTPGSQLLDIGCGTGLFLVAASQAGWSVSGVEVSGEAAELGQAVHKLPVHVGVIAGLKLPDDAFEAVTAWEVLEHIPEPSEFLHVVSRILKPGGIFAGSVPNYGRSRYRFGEHLGPLSCPPIHVNFWDNNSLEYVLRHAGFSNVEVSWPRCTLDLLKPRRRPSLKKITNFLKVGLGFDMVSSMFFMCKKDAD